MLVVPAQTQGWGVRNGPDMEANSGIRIADGVEEFAERTTDWQEGRDAGLRYTYCI